jgi:hypothetical protein
MRLNTDGAVANYGFQNILLADRDKEAIVCISLNFNWPICLLTVL